MVNYGCEPKCDLSKSGPRTRIPRYGFGRVRLIREGEETPSRACGWQPGAGIFGSESPRPPVGACEKSHFSSYQLTIGAQNAHLLPCKLRFFAPGFHDLWCLVMGHNLTFAFTRRSARQSQNRTIFSIGLFCRVKCDFEEQERYGYASTIYVKYAYTPSGNRAKTFT